MTIYTDKGSEIAVRDARGRVYKLRTPERANNAMSHLSNCIHRWHARFSHRDPNAIKELLKNDLVRELKIDDCSIKQICDSCVRGKMSRKPFPKKSLSYIKEPMDLIHIDLCGPMPIQTPEQRRYIMTLIDDYSHYTYVFLLRNKFQVIDVIKDFIQFSSTQFGRKPKAFRSDLGTEYVNQDLKDLLRNKGIDFQHTTAYTPEQNGIAERRNRYLVEAIRTMLIDARLANKYWGEAAVTAVYLQNRLSTKERDATPYELHFKKKPNVGHLKEFGCRAFVHVPKQKRNKLDDKAIECIFVGYSPDSKAYRLLNKSSGKIITSRDVYRRNS